MSDVTQNGYYIYITAADPSTGNLTLSDGGQTGISDQGATYDSVFWVVNDHIANIEAITGVNYQSGTNLFSSGPNPVSLMDGTKSMWGAMFTVKGPIPVGAIEEYTISWKDDTKGDTHTYDPKIIVNP